MIYMYKNIRTRNNQVKIDKLFTNTCTKTLISHGILDNGMKFIYWHCLTQTVPQGPSTILQYCCCNISVVTTSWMLCVSKKV